MSDSKHNAHSAAGASGHADASGHAGASGFLDALGATETAANKPPRRIWNLLRRILLILLALLILLVAALGGVYAWTKLSGYRVAFLVMGLEHARTDTMMAVFVDSRTGIDIVSIPRDTYHPVSGYDGLGQKKLNAVYGFEHEGGAERLRHAVCELLGTEIDYYIALDYDSVAAIVDSMGGVEIDVPFRMYYTDPYADPPLVIDLQPGQQTLTGEQAVGYLRFRQSDDGSYSDGDIGRIKRQQDFVARAIRQAMGFRLPGIVLDALRHVETNMDMLTVTALAWSLIGFDMSGLRIHSLPESYVGPGDDGLYYFFHDPDATRALITDILHR